MHDTTTELDIQFVGRVLLRYEGTVRVLGAPSGQKSGFGDARITAITVLASDPTFVAALITGAVLDTASQPELGAGKQQVILGGGAAIKPRRWLLPYLVVFEQFSVGGKPERASVNQLTIDAGSILFGRGYTWYRLDLNTVVDFENDKASLFGMIEVGRLLLGRVGLFMRTGTQFLGPHQLDYSLGVGVRYLFRLGQATNSRRSETRAPRATRSCCRPAAPRDRPGSASPPRSGCCRRSCPATRSRSPPASAAGTATRRR